MGLPKVEAAKMRALAISPAIEINAHNLFYLPGQTDDFDFEQYDYVIDAVDTVAAKIDIVVKCSSLGVPIISAMGCGNRIDPSCLCIKDIYDTYMDPLAKVMRRELRKCGIKRLKVVCSKEQPIIPRDENSELSHEEYYPTTEESEKYGSTSQVSAGLRTRDDIQYESSIKAYSAHRSSSDPAEACATRRIPGSTAFVPACAGLMLAAEAVRDITGFEPSERVKGGKQSNDKY